MNTRERSFRRRDWTRRTRELEIDVHTYRLRTRPSVALRLRRHGYATRLRPVGVRIRRVKASGRFGSRSLQYALTPLLALGSDEVFSAERRVRRELENGRCRGSVANRARHRTVGAAATTYYEDQRCLDDEVRAEFWRTHQKLLFPGEPHLETHRERRAALFFGHADADRNVRINRSRAPITVREASLRRSLRGWCTTRRRDRS